MRSKLVHLVAVVVAAFLLCTNPVLADAAGKITGKQIKNNSVTGKDIKDETLIGNDVQNNTLTGDDIVESTLTGTNAATLGGQPPSTFQNNIIRVPVAATPSLPAFIKPLPTIANGTYLATININANLSAGNSGFFCSLYNLPVGPNALMASFGSNYGTGALSSINAVKTVTVTGPLELFCAVSAGTFSTPISQYTANEVTFTRLDNVTTTATVARGTAGTRPELAPTP
jgi:hypothetical protein